MTSEAPVLNTALLEEVADYAIDHEGSDNQDNVVWDQVHFRWVTPCNTFMCIAGITCELTGGKWISRNKNLGDFLHIEADDESTLLYYCGTLSITTADARAQRLLGLTDTEARYLFAGDYAGADELRNRVKRISNGEFR